MATFAHRGATTNMTNIQRPTARKKKRTSPERSRLTALIAEATVDAYNESEQRMGFYTMLEEHLDLPFEASDTHSGFTPAHATTCGCRMD